MGPFVVVVVVVYGHFHSLTHLVERACFIESPVVL